MAAETQYIPELQIGTPWQEGDQTIDFNQICMIKAVNNESSLELNPEGKLLVKTLAGLSKGEIPRTTNHWTLNHLVENNNGGSWSAPECVIISPAPSMININGLPANLFSVDTFWDGDMEVPQDSIVFWKNSIPENMAASLYNNRIITADNVKEKELKEIMADIENKNWTTTEELITLDNIAFQISDELAHESQRQINDEIAKMGYTVLDLESGGHYSLHENLDNAISDLGERNSINSATTHTNTFSGVMDSEGVYDGPLINFAKMNRGEISDIEVIHQIINSTNHNLNYYIESGLNKNVRLILAAEIYHWITTRNHDQQYKQELSDDFKVLFDNHPELLEIINNWATKANNKTILDNIKG